MKYKCNRHPDRDIVLFGGYGHCSECSRELEREVIVHWAWHVAPEIRQEQVVKALGKMFQTKDFGFSTFQGIYNIRPRVTKRPYKGSFGFVESQQEYLQKTFLTFIKGGEK